MVNFNFFLKEPKANKETLIYLRFSDKNLNQKKIYLGLKINPVDWNPPKQNARKTLIGFLEFNALLDNYRQKAMNIYISIQNIDGIVNPNKWKEQFVREVLGGKSDTKVQFKSLPEFAEYFISSVKLTSDGKKEKSTNTIIHNNQTIRLLREFENRKKIRLSFERINIEFYNDFVEFLNGKNYSPSSISKHLKNIKHFLNEATERGINTKLDYKSKRFSTSSNYESETIFLTEVEITNIHKIDMSNAETPGLEKAKDLFVVGCFTGLRFSDLSRLSVNNIRGGLIHFTTQKTGEKVVIPLKKEVTEILKKYEHTLKGLPKAISNAKMNEHLKEIGRIAGINQMIEYSKIKGGRRVSQSVPKYLMITTHTARRSFATNLFLSKFPVISIMQITGHKTEKAFLKYIRITKEENAKHLLEHWETTSTLKIAQ